MDVKEFITITLSSEEAGALKALLGTFNDAGKRELGLSDELCIMTSALFDSLPYFEEE